jgi:hypothetical protein
MDKLLTDKEYQLERFSGKGGWTYISLPEIPKDKDAAFGIVKVKGTIDNYELSDVTLMSFSGILIMAVKAEIRKSIGKEEGDYIHLTLYKDTGIFQIPDDFKQLLTDEGMLEIFKSYKKWEQRMCIKWIFSAKREETVKERITKTIFKLKRRERIV